MKLDFEHSFHGDPSLLDEIGDAETFDGGTSLVHWDPGHWSPLSNALGNRGVWCTLTKECQGNCQGG